jgi:hypothetical protein
MSRKQKQSGVELVPPQPLSRDELAVLSHTALEEIRSRLRLEREMALGGGQDTRPWEEEIAYVESAIDRRRSYEAVTPRHLWS